ncbi:MAG: (d)CMP kinase [Acidithiobacillus sp.]
MTAAIPVITLDGPGGVGKGTLSRLLAQSLGWHLLDSGAIYRALAYAAREQGIADQDVHALVAMARALPLRFQGDAGQTRVFLAGEPIDEVIRQPEIGEMASRLAVHPPVRAALLDRQRAFRAAPGLIADGRDMGTVVFPDAPLKVFLTASVEERAKRRLKQLNEQGVNASLSAVKTEIAARDERDQRRSVAPLQPAVDARVLDTSRQAVSETLSILKGWIKDTFEE